MERNRKSPPRYASFAAMLQATSTARPCQSTVGSTPVELGCPPYATTAVQVNGNPKARREHALLGSGMVQKLKGSDIDTQTAARQLTRRKQAGAGAAKKSAA